MVDPRGLSAAPSSQPARDRRHRCGPPRGRTPAPPAPPPRPCRRGRAISARDCGVRGDRPGATRDPATRGSQGERVKAEVERKFRGPPGRPCVFGAFGRLQILLHRRGIRAPLRWRSPPSSGDSRTRQYLRLRGFAGRPAAQPVNSATSASAATASGARRMAAVRPQRMVAWVILVMIIARPSAVPGTDYGAGHPLPACSKASFINSIRSRFALTSSARCSPTRP